jgi:hypothetical protein
MMKTTLVLSLFLSTVAMAQTRGTDLGSEAQRLASEIQRESSYLTRDQAARIQAKFQEIRDILYSPGGGGAPVIGNYSCISRDNDNAAPFVYALRDGINMIRVTGMSFGSLANCQASIQSIKYVGPLALACASRDNDDANPWVFTSLNGGNVVKIANTNTSSLSACKDLMNRMIILGNTSTVAYCKARDNDNASPYVAVNLDLANGQMQTGTERFSDIESCWRFLGN